MNKSYKLFIFDFDGTVGDTKEGIVASFQEALRKNDLPIINREQILRHIGVSLKGTFKELTNGKYDYKFYDKVVADYRIFYRDFLTEKTLPFPESIETLKELKKRERLVSIATAKRIELALLSCQHLQIDKYLDFCIGQDMVNKGKPHPEMLLVTLKKLGVDSKDAVMIGDTTFDIEMGKAINMDTVGVTWGMHKREMLKQSAPTYMIDSFSELLKFTS